MWRRLVSADSLGLISVWDVFPVVRKVQTALRHYDSVQASQWSHFVFEPRLRLAPASTELLNCTSFVNPSPKPSLNRVVFLN